MNPKQIQAIIQAHRNSGARFREKFQKYLDWYLAKDDWFDQSPPEERDPVGDEDLSLDTNMPYAYIDTMIAGVCPTNPKVTIQAGHPDYHTQMKNRERWVNGAMRRNRLYKKGTRAAAHAAVAGYGVTKTIWKVGRNPRPKTSVVDPRRFVWDYGVEDWEDVSYVGEALILKEEQFLSRCKRVKLPGGGTAPATYSKKVAEKAKPGKWPSWLGGDNDEIPTTKRQIRDVFEYVVVWEFYDFVTDTYWHVLDGEEEPLLQTSLPYQYVRNPYDITTFNDNLEDLRGISDVQLIERAQERLNEIDAVQLKHAYRTTPVAVFNEDAVEEPEAFREAIRNVEEPGSAIAVKLTDGRKSIDDVLSYTKAPALPPDLKESRDRAQSQIEFILALPAFMRGGVGNIEVATEAALADSGVRTRNGRRIVEMGNWQASVARKMIGLMAEMWPANRPIPVRDPSAPSPDLLNKEDFAFDERVTLEEDWYMLCEAAPFSPAENHRLVRLQKFAQWAHILFEHPNANGTKLMRYLLEDLEMIEAFVEEGNAPADPVAGQPGLPGQAGTPGNDVPENGAIPPELAAQNEAFQRTIVSPGVSEAPAGG